MKQNSISIFALKVIAITAMTFDHLCIYFPELPIEFRWIGRICIPIFLFVHVQAFIHTSNKKKLFLRLFIFNIICEAIFMVCGFNGNFISTICLLMVVLVILETLKKSKIKGICLLSIFFVYQVFADFLAYLLYNRLNFLHFLSNALFNGNHDILDMITRISLNLTSNNIIFIILGVIVYLTHQNKILFCFSYTFFSSVYFLFANTDFLWSTSDFLYENANTLVAQTFHEAYLKLGFLPLFHQNTNPFSENIQWMMFCSLPLLLLYNGDKGNNSKTIFYLFYPFHIMILTFANFFF